MSFELTIEEVNLIMTALSREDPNSEINTHMKKIFLALVFVLLACKPTANKGADGYTFLQKQYSKSQVMINIVTYKTQRELDAAIQTYLNKSHNSSDKNVIAAKIAAFSLLSPPNYNVCTIHMIDPTVSYQPEYIGHEFLHCVYGQWHKDNTVNNSTP